MGIIRLGEWLSKHTPGPWFSHETGGDEFLITDGQSNHIAKVYNWFEDTNRANAILIAAAPDMLQQLNECLDYFNHEWALENNHPASRYRSWAKDIGGIIAKATGSD